MLHLVCPIIQSRNLDNQNLWWKKIGGIRNVDILSSSDNTMDCHSLQWWSIKKDNCQPTTNINDKETKNFIPRTRIKKR